MQTQDIKVRKMKGGGKRGVFIKKEDICASWVNDGGGTECGRQREEIMS